MKESISLQQAFAHHSIPYPDKPIGETDFTRWGKNNRYYAKRFAEGVHFGDYTAGISETWFSDAPNKTLVSAPGAREGVEAERQKRYEAAAVEVQNLWQVYALQGNSGYLQRKQVAGYGIRYGQGFIVVPLINAVRMQWSEQRIFENGMKKFHAGGKMKGCFHLIGAPDGEAFVCEGYATGATIHAATGKAVYVAFNAGNLEPVIAAIRKHSPNLILIIAADDDRWKPEIGNIGRTKANEAAKRFGCTVALPWFKDNSSKPTDWNDLHVLEGLDVVQSQMAGVQHVGR